LTMSFDSWQLQLFVNSFYRRHGTKCEEF
jgi:hypothetical protein